MSFDSSVFEINKHRYPRSDLFVVMTVDNSNVQFLTTEDGIHAAITKNSNEAFVFDGYDVALKFVMALEVEDQHYYIVPLAAVQILTGIEGGVTPTHKVIPKA